MRGSTVVVHTLLPTFEGSMNLCVMFTLFICRSRPEEIVGFPYRDLCCSIPTSSYHPMCEQSGNDVVGVACALTCFVAVTIPYTSNVVIVSCFVLVRVYIM